jgi:threonine dehydrogenase-like Zn-dependent dehydrogenase
MKAVAVFPGTREVKVVEKELPRLVEPDEVMLHLLDVGICGTDKEICSFEYGTPPAGEDHLVIGHEALAEVVEVGSAVSGLRPGTWWSRPSGVPVLTPNAFPARPGTRTTATRGTSSSAASRRSTAT